MKCRIILLLLLSMLAVKATDDLNPLEFEGVEFTTGKIFRFNQFKGKVIYLDFWASWCGPCRVSLPEIVKIQEALASEKFTVIAINVDKDPEKGIKFLQRYPVNYPVLSDAAGEVAKAFELPGMPSSFVIDHGKISLVHKGYRSGDMMMIRAHIEDLLNESR